MKYVLMWIYFSSTVYSVGTQEFDSKETCEFARATMIETVELNTKKRWGEPNLSWICFMK